MSTFRYLTMKTPIGPFTVVEKEETVVAAGFSGADDVLGRLTQGNGSKATKVRSLGSISDALSDYFDGAVTAIDAIPVDQPGSPYRLRVWLELRKTKPGRTVSYATLARRAGNPRAIRAAGTTCGVNRVPLIVPCHRAVRSDGSLGGYYYGLEMKRWLLDHEQQSG